MTKKSRPRMDEKGTKKHPSTSDEFRIMKRRRRVAEAYLSGKSQVQVAEELGVSVNTIASDLQEIRKVWLAQMREAFDVKKAEELAKLDRLEQASWEAYEASKGKVMTEKRRNEAVRQTLPGARKGGRRGSHVMVPLKEVTETSVRERPEGDPRFLEQVAWCIETRLRTMGLLKGETTNVSQVFIDWAGMMNVGSTVQSPNGRVTGQSTPLLGHQSNGDDVQDAEVVGASAAPTPPPPPERVSVGTDEDDDDPIERKLREAEAQSHLKSDRLRRG